MIKHLIVSLISAIALSGSVCAQEAESLVVHFAFDSYKLSASARGEIDSFFHLGAAAGGTPSSPGYTASSRGDTALVSGFTDSIGSSGYNETLSVRRALAVKDYLVAKGLLAESRIKTTGYGKERPVAGNGSDSERAANRRVEILFRRGHTDIVAGTPPVRRDSVVTSSRDTVSLRAVAPEQRDSAVVAVSPSSPTSLSSPSPLSPASSSPKQTIYDAVMDSTVAVGSTIPLRDVNFYPGRHIPLPSAARILDELARAMKANHRLRISIEGHICCLPDGIDGADLGTMQPNLSVQRAKYVYDYLVSSGVAKRRMSYTGFGASGKLYPREENEEQRAENRRVEIRIMAR